MKKWMILVLCFAVAIVMCACGETKTENEAQKEAISTEESSVLAETKESSAVETVTSQETETAENPSDESGLERLVLVINEVEIAMDEEAAPILEQLGVYEDMFEQVGCAGLGTMRYYYYAGFDLGTYENAEGIECIYSFSFTNDVYETPEGLCLGDTMSRAESLYGAYGEVEETIISVVIGNTALTIQGKDGSVIAIQYLSKAASALQ